MGQVFTLPTSSTGTISDADAHTLDLYLPQMPNFPRPVNEGRITLVIKPTLVTGTTVITNLTISVQPIITPSDQTVVIPTIHASSDYTALTTLFNAQTWVDAKSYVWDISFLAGLVICFGFRVSITYTSGDGTHEIVVLANLICE